jgi:predicted pyridoxine 5'-phosphate oxidase superfamily flavin-nucleotide-binding protein
MTVAVSQSFGNCPQYIQRRTVHPAPHPAQPPEFLTSLDEAAAALISQADTLFVASRSRSRSGEHGGADISHRGGRPGFVRIDGDTLWIPDFHGNRYFNTLGNLLGEPRAALLFVDFERGDLLHLQGLAEIDWTATTGRRIEGAERSWAFHITRGWRRRAALPLRWTFVDQAPTTARTGIWH